jgi:S-formylglutathione hydrolase FrmB
MTHRSRTLFTMAALIVALSCNGSTDTTTNFNASLSGSKEVPAVTSSGTGTFTATLDEDNRFAYTLSFSGLTSASNGAHIHGPASTTQNANVLVNFASLPPGNSASTPLTLGATSGTTAGTVNLESTITSTVSGDSLRKLLDAGLLYVNVHTANNQGGEIRGQITKQ